MMDNFQVDINSKGHDQLRKAFALFEPQINKVVGFSVSDSHGLIFYWAASPKMTLLPFKMTLEQAADFAFGWLQEADYGVQPDHDGDNGLGWRLYCEAWGHVAGDSCAFAAVRPIWAMYGK